MGGKKGAIKAESLTHTPPEAVILGLGKKIWMEQQQERDPPSQPSSALSEKYPGFT